MDSTYTVTTDKAPTVTASTEALISPVRQESGVSIPKAYVITLRETMSMLRWHQTEQHLVERGMSFEPFIGINGARWGLATNLVYAVDNPGEGFKIGSKTIGITLSHYMLWKVLSYMPGPGGSAQLPQDFFLICEDDVRLEQNWRDGLTEALLRIPDDWDMLYVGSCCVGGQARENLGANLYRVPGPQCLHCYAVRRKALPIMLETQQLAWAGIDVQLLFKAHPKMKVYAILPRLAFQEGTFLHP